MGRRRGSNKFSFPLPRKSRGKAEDDDARSTPSIPSLREWPSFCEDSSTSKAHRVLGTSAAVYQPTSSQPSVPASPGYISITVSEASFGSQVDDRISASATGYNRSRSQPGMARRPSSNILGRIYSKDGRRGSDSSSASHRLQSQTSNSTMRSHYDATTSPLSISQQTSDSAVRDRALRRGQPQVVTDYDYNCHVANPLSPVILGENQKKESRKNKPARLDLSKLFPKPKTGENHNHANVLLSPTKMVNSPAAMSTTSDYFPRPMTREPTPQMGGQVRLKSTSQHQQPTVQTPTSPVRKFRRDEYDNAKVHVRRPPKGVQHWFDALDEDSDEVSDEARGPIYAPKAIRPNEMPKIPVRKTSLGHFNGSIGSQQLPRSHYVPSTSRNDTFAHEDIVDVTRLISPSQFSVNSLGSINTKESTLSKSNLQDSSILSFSSSEDENEFEQLQARKFEVRKSLEVTDEADEVIIGQARAFELRANRRPSEGKISMRSISTNAATIEVMYTPEPPFPPPYHFPRSCNLSGSWRSSHTRQPSIIPEDEDTRPVTASNMILSPSSHSIRSARTSTSEPKPRTRGSHKLMAVTAEEEALLEMMRKKRAAMAKKERSQVNKTSLEKDKQKETSTKDASRRYRTSGFLSMEVSPVRGVEPKRVRKAVPPSPLLLAPRGRPLKTAHDSRSTSQSSDSSAKDLADQHTSPVIQAITPHFLPTPSEFSPLDPFPPSSPTPTASVTSPTTTDQHSSLPSPITPGLRVGEGDVAVKVASSDTSSHETEDVSILDTGVIGPPSDGIKSDSSSHELSSQHQRRRTASSAADVTFPTPPIKASSDLASVTESSSHPASFIEQPLSRPPRKNSRRVNGLTLSTNGQPRNRSSTRSSNSRSSAYSPASGYLSGADKRASRGLSRGNSIASARTTRNSVSEDVLAAWNSLGGTY